jgi:hypothetical protein
MPDQSTDILPCQLNINCLRGGDAVNQRPLTSAQKRSAEGLRLEFDCLIAQVGIKPLLFLTVTFADPVPGRITREIRYLRFRKYFLELKFKFGFTVFDRSPTGRPHYHLILVGGSGTDFHTGFNFDAWDASQFAHQMWIESSRADRAAEQRWRALTSTYIASVSDDLRDVWSQFQDASRQYELGRINAMPIKNRIACGLYLAGGVTNGCRRNHKDDRGIRRVRFWGNFPRKVTQPFYRVTKGSTRWRGKLAFCAHVLGFTEFNEFKNCFGPRWFIHLKGIIRVVPTAIAETSLLTPNLPLNLLEAHREKIKKIEIELLDRLERYGYRPQPDHDLQTNFSQTKTKTNNRKNYEK